MLKVLLVDDEAITIRMLQNLIDWKKYNLELAGHAEDGLKAVEMFLKYDPDIVISDIRMPGMTGIELIKKIKGLNKETAFILVTAYSDFSYISEALKIGCSDYILKPIDEHELDDALKRVVEKITGEKKQKEIINKSKWQTRNHILQSFMKTGSRLNHITNKKMEYPINFENYHVLMIQLNHKTIDEYSSMQHIEITKIEYISRVIEEALEKHSHILFEYEDDAWVVLLSDVELEELVILSVNLKKQLLEQFEMNVIVCFSDLITQLETLTHEYTKVRLLSRYSFYIGSDDILGYGYNCNEKEFSQVRGLELVKEMESALIENDRKEVDNLLNEIFFLSKNIHPSTLNVIYDICYQIITFIKKVISKNSKETLEINSILKLSSGDLQAYKSVDSLKRFMWETIDMAMTKIEVKQEGISDIVEHGIRILKDNFDKNLSLDAICAEISVSKNYFSYLFKREMGISVWTYLTELRLDKAKKLLKETNLKSYEVSFQVGYENPSYFSMLFKNYESMTPSEYRKLSTKIQ